MTEIIQSIKHLKPVLQVFQQIPFELQLFFILFGFLLFSIKWGKKRHLLCVLTASQELKRIKRLDTPQKQLNALRGVNPFVFEEMILTALKRAGHEITRNKKIHW
jgi:restriction system protein